MSVHVGGVAEPDPKLGSAFWILWSMGMAATALAMIASLWAVNALLDMPASAIAGGAVVIAFTLAFVGLAMLPQGVRVKRGAEQPMRPPYRRYVRRFLPAMFGYVACLMGAVIYYDAMRPTGAGAWAAALAPGIPLLFAIRAIALLLKEDDDEVSRARQVFAHTFSTHATLAVCSVWGFLDLFDRVPGVELWAVFPVWAAGLGLGQAFAQRRFG